MHLVDPMSALCMLASMQWHARSYVKIRSTVVVGCLHCPADTVLTCLLQALLGLGSGVNARDKGGATPLFVACESGHANSAKLLLHAGADVLLRNSAGEAPLYIAALRGEIKVVDVLLNHMRMEGVRWQVSLLAHTML